MITKVVPFSTAISQVFTKTATIINSNHLTYNSDIGISAKLIGEKMTEANKFFGTNICFMNISNTFITNLFPITWCEKVCFLQCDKNFVHYTLHRQTFPYVKEIYLLNSPPTRDVTLRDFKNSTWYTTGEKMYYWKIPIIKVEGSLEKPEN